MAFKKTGFALLLILLTLVYGVVAAEEADQTDTRILIDISGSMKENDPRNLRRSALRLIVGLMPNENRAGVWTFAQYTNMLVPLGVINDNWKKRAKSISEKIRSPGLYTNIEDVLRKSTQDWEGSASKYRKNVILLTDGMVDISKNKRKNQESRKKILEELAPKIKALGGQIHTIALSERADHDLMKSLSNMTDGWYEQVNNAEELQRVFLRMFEKVGKPDSVPLVGNKFTLDNSIDEATLLVFNRDKQKPTRIMRPGGKIFDASKPPSNVDWHTDDGYDLITIRKPKSGEWTIEANMDPDNRVMVVTDLKMKTTDVPNRLAIGEVIPVEVFFQEKGKTIERREFLEVVQVTTSQIANGEQTESRPLKDDGASPDRNQADGIFSVNLGEGLAEGKVELVIDADGKTFVRQRRQATQIVQPVEVRLEDSAEAQSAVMIVTLDQEVISPDNLKIDASLEDQNGQRTPISFTRTPDGAYEAVVDKTTFTGRQFPMVDIEGQTLSGNAYLFQPRIASITGLAEPEPVPEAVAEPAPETEPEAQAEEPEMVKEPEKPASKREPEPVEQPAEEPEPEEAGEETDWLSMGLIIGGVNLLLVLIGGGVWWFLRKGNKDDDALAMFDDDDEPSGNEEGGESSEEEMPSGSDDTKDDTQETGEADAEKTEDELPDETVDISSEDKK